MVINLSAVTVTCQNSYKDDGAQLILGVHQIEGELIAIDSTNVIIFKSGVSFKLKMAPQAKILCNDLFSSWQSLRPITPQAFFDCRIILNALNQVILLDGYYRGEECIILKWQFDKEGLFLYLTSMVDQQNKWLFVISDARLPVEQWLATGQVIYVLYNRDGQIRGVYLPD